MSEREQVSERALAVCARFGIDPEAAGAERAGDEGRGVARVAAHLLALGAGRIALVTGPSGGGKSTMLRAVVESDAPGLRCFAVESGARAARAMLHRGPRVIDQFPGDGVGDLDLALRALGRAGLSEARLIAGRVSTLSDGERSRLALAMALYRAMRFAGRRPGRGRVARPGRPGMIVADEFASTLDRTTARTIARTLARCVRSQGLRAVVATAHDDVLGALAPDVLVYQPLRGAPVVVARPAGGGR